MKEASGDKIESLAFNDDLSCLICASSTGYCRLFAPAWVPPVSSLLTKFSPFALTNLHPFSSSRIRGAR